MDGPTRGTSKSQHFRRLGVSDAARALLASILVVASMARADGRETQPDAKPASVADVDPARIIPMLPGIVEPARQASLSVPRTSVVMELRVDEGECVAANQVVAVLDNRVALAELGIAAAENRKTAAIDQAESELKRSERLLTRLLLLRQSRAVSESEIEEATSRRDQAAAVLAAGHEQAVAAERRLELARARVEALNIRAPFAGSVLRVDAHPGETVSQDETLVQLADLRTLRVELRVPLQWYDYVSNNREFLLAAGSPFDRCISAELLSCEPMIDAATQTFRCVFTIDNAERALLGGFAVRLMRPQPN